MEQPNQQSIQEESRVNRDFQPPKKSLFVNKRLYLFIVLVAVVLTVGGILLLKGLSPAPDEPTPPVIQQSSPPAPQPQTQDTIPPQVRKSFATQGECEAETGKKCDFIMCDYVPPGKTFEEVCGKDFKKGWQATSEPAQVDTSNWQTYRNDKFNIEFKHPSYWIVEEYDETTDSVTNANHVDFSDGTDNNLTYSLRFGFLVYQNPNRLPLRDYLIQEKVNIMYPLVFDLELSWEEIERRLREWRVATFKGYDSLQNPENTKLFISVGQNVFMLYMDSLVEGTNSFAYPPFNQILSTLGFVEKDIDK